MTEPFGIFLCTFGLTLLTGIQSQNLAGRHKRASFITSALISLMSLLTVKIIASHTGLLTDIAYIFGGPFGILASLKIYPWMRSAFPGMFSRRVKG